MRTTLSLDDHLFDQAQSLTGLKKKSTLIHEALKALIERESARRLALLGSTEQTIKPPSRRRPSKA
jgi:Arc/MetJ family transcription regulator